MSQQVLWKIVGSFNYSSFIFFHNQDDLTGWQDSVLKELERKHTKERNLLLDLLQEGDSEDFKQEAREMSVDERNQRLTTLKTKRDALDLSIKCKKFVFFYE